jgi:prepilin-type processing-associated H-X9-DG protein
MSKYKVGDLVRYCIDDARGEDGLFPSFIDYGIVIARKTIVDPHKIHRHNSYLTVLWADGTLGHVADNDFTVIELLNLTGSQFYS